MSYPITCDTKKVLYLKYNDRQGFSDSTQSFLKRFPRLLLMRPFFHSAQLTMLENVSRWIILHWFRTELIYCPFSC